MPYAPTQSLRFWRLATLCIMLPALASLASAGAIDRIKANKKVVIAYSRTSSPFSLDDENGQPVGYGMDMCSRVVESLRKKLGVSDLKVEYVTPPLQERLEGVKTGRIDMGCGSTARTEERLQVVEFSLAYFIGPLRTIVKSNSPVQHFKDLARKTMALPSGTEAEKVARTLDMQSSLNFKYKITKTSPEAFAAVGDGSADGFMMDDVMLATLRANSAHPEDFRLLTDIHAISEVGILLPKNDPAFKALVDQELVRVMREGEAARLYDKWFQSPIPPQGKNLALPLNQFLREHFKYPADGYIKGR